MIKATNNIRAVKEEIKRHYNKGVCVHVELGRNKSADFTGVLSGVYPALFTVRPDDGSYRGKTAYSYAEILCGKVTVRARDPECGA